MLIKAMLANEAKYEDLLDYCNDDNYWLEQKLDGHRILLEFEDGVITAKERHGNTSQHNAKFQTDEWRAVQAAMENRTFILDGEYISGEYYVFDLPYCDSVVAPMQSYDVRRAVLDTMAENLGLKLVPTARTTEEKLDLLELCIKSNAEGVMIKHRDGHYDMGMRSNNCLKGKFTKTADVVVTAKGIGGKENMTLCVWRDNQLVEIGRCSSIGKPKVELGEVIEVKYLYLGSNNKLVQPTMMKKRPDKESKECTFAQLRPTNKKVLV